MSRRVLRVIVRRPNDLTEPDLGSIDIAIDGVFLKDERELSEVVAQVYAERDPAEKWNTREFGREIWRRLTDA